MKLRIRGDSVRLRLTQGEVRTLAERGSVVETTSFGGSQLAYAIVLGDVRNDQTLAASLVATAQESRIEVRVETNAGRTWAASDAVGLESVDGRLRIVVEKDYACLKDRPHEDDADAFPNPNTTC